MRILVASVRVPTPDFDAASARLEHLLDVLVADGHAVSFACTHTLPQFAHRQPHDEARLRAKGVDLVDDVRAHVVADGSQYHLVVASYLAPAHHLAPLLASHAPQARTVFDTVDVDHVRLFRTAKITCNQPMLARALRSKAVETATIGSYHHTFAVSDAERALLARLCPTASISVLGAPREVRAVDDVPPVHGRQGAVFVGNFLHLPNQDAMTYYVEVVLPAFASPPPLRIVGGGDNRVVDALARAGVERVGWVNSVAAELDRARVFVAPLRFGSGIKGKVLEAMAHGLPVVTSSIGAEGLAAVPGRDLLVEDRPDAFAAAVARVLADDELWSRLSCNGLARAAELCSFSRFRDQLRVVTAR